MLGERAAKKRVVQRKRGQGNEVSRKTADMRSRCQEKEVARARGSKSQRFQATEVSRGCFFQRAGGSGAHPIRAFCLLPYKLLIFETSGLLGHYAEC